MSTKITNPILKQIIAQLRKAELELGELEFGQTVDWIADNLPSLPLDDCTYAATIVRMIKRGELELVDPDGTRITDHGKRVLQAKLIGGVGAH